MAEPPAYKRERSSVMTIATQAAPLPPRSRLTLRFTDPELEAAYQAEFVESEKHTARVGYSALLAASPLYMVGLAGIPLLLVCMALAFTRARRRAQHPMGSLACVCWWGCMAVSCAHFPAPSADVLHAVSLCLTTVCIYAETIVLAFATGWWRTSGEAIVELIALALCSVAFVWCGRINEDASRRAWGALFINVSLKDRIDVLEAELGKSRCTTAAEVDLDSPLEKVLSALREAMRLASSGGSGKTISEKMSFAIETLTRRTDLFTADLQSQIKERNIELDDETAQWLLNEITATRRMGSVTAVEGPSENSFHNDSVSLQSSVLTVEQVSNWNIDIFDVQDRIGVANILVAVTSAILNAARLPELLGINGRKLHSYIARIACRYNDIPFHNQLHAADVTQSLWCLITCLNQGTLTPLETFALIMAAVTHDVDHPGLNNAYQVATSSRLALLYNDKSVLENHHLSTAFLVLQEEDMNFMKDLSVKEQLRSLWIDLVLATDMSYHLEYVAKFNTKITAGFDLARTEDRLVLMQMLLKASDVNNIARPLRLYKHWTDLVLEEFFAQGDKERDLGLPVSPFMDRHLTSVAKSQESFIEYVGKPLFSAVCAYSPNAARMLSDTMEKNLRFWKGLAGARLPTKKGMNHLME
eukprot:m51a1_g10057 putative camp-specific 3 -cyclic phosphodiesterase 4c isoform x2 (645) ;mRNA; f:70198-72673